MHDLSHKEHELLGFRGVSKKHFVVDERSFAISLNGDY